MWSHALQQIIEKAMTGIGIGVIAGILAVLAALPWKRKTQPGTRFRLAAVVLLGAAYIAPLLAAESWPGWKPGESWLWVMHAVGAATIIAAAVAALPASWLGRLAGAVAAAGVVGWLFHTPANVETSTPWQMAVAGSVLLGWVALEPLASKRTGVTVPLGLGLVFIAAFVLLLDRMNFARAAPPLAAGAAAMGMIALGALVKPSIDLARGALLVALPMLTTTIAAGWLAVRAYTDLDWWVPIAVAAAPLALWVGEVPPVRNRRPWVRVTIAVAATVLIAGGALILAVLTAEPDPYAGY